MYLFFGGEPYTLSYSQAKQAASWFKPRQEKTGVPYDISKNSQIIGDISIRVSDGGLLSRFDYYSMSLCGREYSMYKIGLGKAGMKYPIYNNARQIALLEKDVTVYNNLDTYHATTLDTNVGLVTFLFCLYLDMREFSNRGRIVCNSVEKSYCYTTKRQLKAMYNPNFKEQIEK